MVRFCIIFLALFLFTTPLKAEVNLPDDFTLKPFASVPDARSMAAVPELGVVFVGTRSNSIYAVYDQDQNGVAEKVTRLTSRLHVPNGIAWKDGSLYVVEQHRLVRFNIGQEMPETWPSPEVLYDKLPNKRWHGWRYAAFGPDGGLYVAIGAPCNICELRGFEGTIIRFDPKTWTPTIYAHGVRNSVGITFDPQNGDMVFTDNGADNMGDDVPPCELNRASSQGVHFGYPYYGGGSARTSQFKDHTIPENQKPVHEFQAHVAPLGIEFYQGNRFPERYKRGVFVAQHGSWNRTIPVGYQISFLPMDSEGNVLAEENFITGWLGKDESITGRPVDLEIWADGRMLISDDSEDIIYILDYQK